MKYLIIVCILAASCSSLRKSVNQQKQEVNKSTLTTIDSIGRLSVDTSSVININEWGSWIIDSGYDKVTEEVVKEVIDSGVIRRKITRTIKEKGQKRVEQTTQLSRYDSIGKNVDQNAELKTMQKVDSNAVAVTKQKEVKRTTFLPWWIWLIAAVVGVVAWWKRNPIIDFFT